MNLTVVKQGELEYLAAPGISVPHCFTTRYGGVSTGSLSSLNLGLSRGDDRANVEENYARLGAAVGFDPHKAVLCRQVHSDIVRRVGAAQHGAGLYAPPMEDCDALITNEPGTALVTFTADCTPILFYDPRTGAVGAAHAGWRGTASAIAARTVEAMAREFGTRPGDLCCAIGPNIGSCCFETHDDVPQAMLAAFGEEVRPFIRPAGEKFHVDLKQINAFILRRAGVHHIDISTDCTAYQHQRFWSHRVTRGDRGSQGAVILCKEKNP